MGIKSILFFGVKFEYHEISHITINPEQELKELIEEIGTNNISNVWGEIFGTCVDAKEQDNYYLYGIHLDNEISLKKLNEKCNENEMNKQIEKLCNKYKLPIKKCKILCFYDVS